MGLSDGEKRSESTAVFIPSQLPSLSRKMSRNSVKHPPQMISDDGAYPLYGLKCPWLVSKEALDHRREQHPQRGVGFNNELRQVRLTRGMNAHKPQNLDWGVD